MITRRSMISGFFAFFIKKKSKNVEFNIESVIKFKLNNWILVLETATNGIYYLTPEDFREITIYQDGITYRLSCKQHTVSYKFTQSLSGFKHYYLELMDYSFNSTSSVSAHKVTKAYFRIID